ncbi:hypothetical protein MASR1M90_08440 [Desulfovibrionales bacterium]
MMTGRAGQKDQTDFVLPANHCPVRLDAALALGFALGRRQARERIAAGQVRVNGRKVGKGELVQPGQYVTLIHPEHTEDSVSLDAGPPSTVFLVTQTDSFAALHKPAHMHTVRGREQQCLETWLEHLGLPGWSLINRLDFLTSGLVLAAASDQARNEYARWQDAALVQKWYLAWAYGQVKPMTLRGRILDHQRRMVRVTDQDDVPVRWTTVRPLVCRENATLVLAHIVKGRRHQIRAHLAHAGHPLLGDPVYGCADEGFFLHHYRVELPGFTATLCPDWAPADLISL